MRIRISLLPPLEPLKAWTALPQQASPTPAATIADLKSQLVREVPALAGFGPEHLALEVDGYEMLDGSGLAVLDGEKDVLEVKLRAGAKPSSDKGKTSSSQLPAPSPVTLPAASQPETSSSSRKKRKLSPPPGLSSILPNIEAPRAKKKPRTKTTGAPAPVASIIIPPSTAASSAPQAAALPLAAPLKPNQQLSQSKALASLPQLGQVVRQDRGRVAAPANDEDSSSDSDSDSDSISSSSSSSSSGSSSSASLSSSSAPSSSSSNSSSSDSDSDSDLDSDSHDGPEVASSKKSPALIPSITKANGKGSKSTTIRLTPIIPANPPVPPGQGLASTHDRNVRRRKKKADLKTKAKLAAQTLASSTPPLSLPTPAPPAEASHLISTQRPAPTPEFIVPFSGRANKSKAPGFGSNNVDAAATKTVFTAIAPSTPSSSSATATKTAAAGVSPAQIPLPASPAANGSGFTTPRNGRPPRPMFLPPPSQRTDLPQGMFVTSVDVEAPGWEETVGGGAWAGSNGGGGCVGGQEEEGKDEDGTKGWAAWAREEEEEAALKRAKVQAVAAIEAATKETAATVAAALTAAGEKEQQQVMVAKETPAGPVDWDALEQGFDGMPLAAWEQLAVVGKLIGWKELILNAETFRPELALHVARVKTARADSITVVLVRRLAVVEDDRYEDGEEEMIDVDDGAEEEAEERELTLVAASGGGFKVLG